MRERRTQEGDFEHAGAANIADELPSAGQVARVLFSAQTRADALPRFVIHAKMYTIRAA
jgi:hypothetical protein